MEDKTADRYRSFSLGLAVTALLAWGLFVLSDDAKVYLAVGVVSTVASAMYRVLAHVRAIEHRLERDVPSEPPANPVG